MEYRVYVGGLLAIGIAGCGGGMSGESFEAPLPSAKHSYTANTLGALPDATVNVPIELELTTALQFIERQVPTTIGDIDQRMTLGDHPRTQVSYQVRRGPFRLWGKGRTFYLGATVHYMAKGWYDPPVAPAVSGSCGTPETMPRAKVVVAIEPRVTSDWKLVGAPRIVSLEPLTDTERDQCEITFLNIDVTKTVLSAAREMMGGVLREMSVRMGSSAVRKQAEVLWAEVQQPIALEDSVWLMLRPQRMRLSPLEIKGDRAHGFIGVDARPTIVAGRRPAPGQLPLTNLATEAVAPRFFLTVEGRIGYFLFERALRDALIGSELKLAGGVVRIENVTVSAADSGRIAVGLRVDGTTKGTVYFTGRLTCDSATGKVSIAGFDYDATTASLLIRGLAWLKAADLTEYVHTKATIAIGSAFDNLTKLAVQAMNREIVPGIALQTTLNGSQLSQILLLQDQAIVHAKADGTAQVQVTDRFLETLWQ